MHHFMTEAATTIRQRLTEYFEEQTRNTLQLEPWGPDVRSRLQEYALRGKLIRGALVPFSYRAFLPEGTVPGACYDAGVAMELLQAFLLVHDDIMDQDSVRRGGPAIHTQFETSHNAHPGARQYGVSQGICTGDVAAFLAMERLATLNLPPEMRSSLTALTAREIVSVGLAQMQDVHHGYIDRTTTDAILHVYTYKTGRYTFSLPMMIGCTIAGGTADQIEGIARFGEQAGRIFQIRDDQLGIFGSSEEIGKPAGSDIREDKKTLFREALLQKLPDHDPVRGFFGSPLVGPGEVEAIREAIIRTGVLQEVDALVDRETEAARATISGLGLEEAGTEALRALLDYNRNRTR